jgi:hypothetical protein
VNFLSMTSTQFYTSGKAFRGWEMVNLKFPAVIAAVVLMLSVSAEANAGRPNLISGIDSPSTVRAIPSVDRSRRQINRHVVLLPVSVAATKLADRPRPISNLIQARVAFRTFGGRPGRLSAEFSAVSKRPSIGFVNRHGQLTNRFNAIATPSAMNFTFEDRSAYTSSLSKATTSFVVHTAMGSANQHRNVYEIRFTMKSGRTYRQAVRQLSDTSTTSAVLNRAAAAFAVIHDNN